VFVGFYSPKPKLDIGWNCISFPCLSVPYSELLFLGTLMEDCSLTWSLAPPRPLIKLITKLQLLMKFLFLWTQHNNCWPCLSPLTFSSKVVGLSSVNHVVSFFLDRNMNCVGITLEPPWALFESHYQSFCSFDSSKTHDHIILSHHSTRPIMTFISVSFIILTHSTSLPQHSYVGLERHRHSASKLSYDPKSLCVKLSHGLVLAGCWARPNYNLVLNCAGSPGAS
jgi:hypothetical protein